MASLAGIISLGPWGGSGGDHWSFRPSSGLTEITIHADSNIKSLSFTEANGDISGTFGGNNPNDWGEEIRIKIDWPSEYFTTISGTYGNYDGLTVITSLTFTTNRTNCGPFGNVRGHKFSIPIANSVVVGFHGRSGYYLDAIGIYVQPVDPNGSISLGPWGAVGVASFRFKVATWIKEITVYAGDCVNSLAFKDYTGDEYGPFGDPNEHGDKKPVEIDGPSEYLTSITGTYGTHKVETPVITSLSFITNLTTYGPFGTGSGTPFSLPIEGSFVIGFFGRANSYIDAIGIYVKPKPTT